MKSIRMKFHRWCVGGCLSLSVVFAQPAAAQQDWSHLHPPPVRVAGLEKVAGPEGIASRERSQVIKAGGESAEPFGRSVAPMKHWTPTLHDAGAPDGLVDLRELPPTAWRAPTHRTIEVPQPRPEPTRTFYDSGDQPIPRGAFSSGSVLSGSHSVGSHSSAALHHGPILPDFPGVENDPRSAGPGHLGMGANWIRERPTLNPPIPGASVSPRWKAPYSYGHFGAEPKRHWTRQYGYRDRSLQWTLR